MYHELRTCDVNRYMILPKIIKSYDFIYTAANDVCAADPPPPFKKKREKRKYLMMCCSSGENGNLE